MKKHLLITLNLVLITFMTQLSNAAVIAAFNPAKNFIYNYGATFELMADKQVVSFAYDPSAAFYSALPSELQVLSISAHLNTWTANTESGAFYSFGTVNQPLRNISFKFTNATSMTIGGVTYAPDTINLLSGDSDAALLTVTMGYGGQITYASTTLENLVYSADFIPGLSNYINTSFSLTGNRSNSAVVFNNYLSQNNFFGSGLSVKLNGNFSADFSNPNDPKILNFTASPKYYHSTDSIIINATTKKATSVSVSIKGFENTISPFSMSQISSDKWSLTISASDAAALIRKVNSTKVTFVGIAYNASEQSPPKISTIRVISSSKNVAIRYLSARMIDSHTLDIHVEGKFDYDPTYPKSIFIETTKIGNISFDSTKSNCFFQCNADVTDFKHDFIIDLEAAKVERFKETQRFQVKATASIDGLNSTQYTINANIPLPVIFVHGILTDVLGDGYPDDMFQYLKQHHNTYTPDRGKYTSEPYPTLVSFQYESLTYTAEDISFLLSDFIRTQVIAKTFADKVFVVAHSLGGVVSREAIQSDVDNVTKIHSMKDTIKKLILIGSPSEGSIWAPIVLSYWYGIKSALIIPERIEPFFNSVTFAKASAGSKRAVEELCPTYDWYSYWPGTTDYYIPSEYYNFHLENLNSRGLNRNVSYYTIVASKWFANENYLHLGVTSWIWGYWAFFNQGDGDGFVSLRSQLAMNTDWKEGDGPGLISRYRPNGRLRDIGGVIHWNETTNTDTFNFLNEILWAP